MYHQVAPEPHPRFREYTVTPRAFAAQMHWLSAAGFQAVTLDQWLDRSSGRPRLPAKPVVITFDDGFAECAEYAVPILRARGFTAIFYLVAGLTGETSQWLVRELGIEFPLLDWRTARELERNGFQCGAHTATHPRLATLDETQCWTELVSSRQLLGENLGHEVRHLAYPFGSFNEQVREIAARAGFRSACSTLNGFCGVNDDPLALPRIHVSGHDSLLDFVFRLRTARSAGEWVSTGVRKTVRGLRRRVRGG